ncbi:MAG: FGGY family pentulose kinase, partial [Candidatus Sumerlaeia bacterium]|nr:FGGY family pentulose kinase [Candidatus Sumerlaeia bacterium]
ISPEMQPPKLLWLKENNPDTFRAAAHFFDLPDYLVHRATGSSIRSLCTTACKWTFLGHRVKAGEPSISGWEGGFWRDIGLEEFPGESYTRIGVDIQAPGSLAGTLSSVAAGELGLPAGIPVGVSIIDAHAGGLGLIGAGPGGKEITERELGRRIALIGGTSSCHMAVSTEPRYIDGVWGPYFSAMVPGLWLTEGGQSATGALLDHVIESHPAKIEITEMAAERNCPVYQVLEEIINDLAREEGLASPAELTRHLHVLPYFHGNRSPRADPTLRGVISGLTMDRTVGSLARCYLATLQSIAYGTRHILDELSAKGYEIDTIMACGGGTKSDLYLQTHADACGRPIILGKEPEAVLLGSAMLGATASGNHDSIGDAMKAMSRSGRIITPGSQACLEYHRQKYTVFQRMYEHYMEIRTLMK